MRLLEKEKHLLRNGFIRRRNLFFGEKSYQREYLIFEPSPWRRFLFPVITLLRKKRVNLLKQRHTQSVSHLQMPRVHKGSYTYSKMISRKSHSPYLRIYKMQQAYYGVQATSLTFDGSLPLFRWSLCPPFGLLRAILSIDSTSFLDGGCYATALITKKSRSQWHIRAKWSNGTTINKNWKTLHFLRSIRAYFLVCEGQFILWGSFGSKAVENYR